MIINVAYKQNFIKSKETKEVITNFGLHDFKENVVVKDFEFNLEYGKIYYIYGYSGSGKSTLLNAINEELSKNSEVIYIKKWDRLSIPNKPLIEFFTDISIDERLSILGKCGLGEAWKFISFYEDLSDGEKFRFILYHSLMSMRGKLNPVIIFDEFCATLDRITAKAIANNVRKLAEKFGVTMILASAHDDLKDYLSADYVIFKEFYEKIEPMEAKQKQYVKPKKSS